MNKTILVALREFVENLSTKTFWIGIFIFPIILVASVVVPTLLEKSKRARTFAVMDHSGWLHDEVMQLAMQRDLNSVLLEAVEAHKNGHPMPSSFPSGVAPFLEKVTHENAHELASAIAFEADTSLIESDAAKLLSDWWRNLSEDQARTYDSWLMAAHYRITDTYGDDVASLNEAIDAETLFAYITIQAEPLDTDPAMTYVCNNFTDESLKHWYGNLVNDVVRRKRVDRYQIDPAIARLLTTPVRMEARKITAEGQEAHVETKDTLHQWVPIAFVYLLWISVFSISQMLLTNTVEEKSNRIIEVLLSSVSPLQLMSGKILGIAATGLTIILSWILFFFFALKALPFMMGMPLSFDLSFIMSDFRYLGSFVAYFMFGYFFYAALLVGMGSVCNSLKEAQNLMTPVILILLVPMFAMVPVGQDPNGTLAKVLSFFPHSPPSS